MVHSPLRLSCMFTKVERSKFIGQYKIFCAPRPLSPEDKDRNLSRSSFRNTSASWQLVRARRLRMPKSVLPSEETVAPTSSALRARIDLERRVQKFLSNDQD
ncbi:unnamed protein product, partial [Iphiclides podalirius]